MPATIEDIRGFLDEKGIKYLFDAEKEVIIINFSPNVVLVKLEEEGEFLQFRTLNFYQYKSGNYREKILELLAGVNYQRKSVKFGYDLEDGEINGCVDLPLEDSNLTATQFFRCLAALLESLDEVRSRFIAILETGEDPGPGACGTVDELVEEIMESFNEENEENFKQDLPEDGE